MTQLNDHTFIYKTSEELIEEHRIFNKRREEIRKKNEKLIAYWNSIPWWQFWKQPSFETKRAIILSNWGQFRGENL